MPKSMRHRALQLLSPPHARGDLHPNGIRRTRSLRRHRRDRMDGGRVGFIAFQVFVDGGQNGWTRRISTDAGRCGESIQSS